MNKEERLKLYLKYISKAQNVYNLLYFFI